MKTYKELVESFYTRTIEKYPEGYSFSNTINFLKNNPNPMFQLIHGSIMNHTGKRIPHAWVEHGDMVHDPTASVSMNKQQYYDHMQAQADSKYQSQHATSLSDKTRNHGPWTKRQIDSFNKLNNTLK